MRMDGNLLESGGENIEIQDSPEMINLQSKFIGAPCAPTAADHCSPSLGVSCLLATLRFNPPPTFLTLGLTAVKWTSVALYSLVYLRRVYPHCVYLRRAEDLGPLWTEKYIITFKCTEPTPPCDGSEW